MRMSYSVTRRRRGLIDSAAQPRRRMPSDGRRSLPHPSRHFRRRRRRRRRCLGHSKPLPPPPSSLPPPPPQSPLWRRPPPPLPTPPPLPSPTGTVPQDPPRRDGRRLAGRLRRCRPADGRRGRSCEAVVSGRRRRRGPLPRSPPTPSLATCDGKLPAKPRAVHTHAHTRTHTRARAHTHTHTAM